MVPPPTILEPCLVNGSGLGHGCERWKFWGSESKGVHRLPYPTRHLEIAPGRTPRLEPRSQEGSLVPVPRSTLSHYRHCSRGKSQGGLLDVVSMDVELQLSGFVVRRCDPRLLPGRRLFSSGGREGGNTTRSVRSTGHISSSLWGHSGQEYREYQTGPVVHSDKGAHLRFSPVERGCNNYLGPRSVSHPRLFTGHGGRTPGEGVVVRAEDSSPRPHSSPSDLTTLTTRC